MCVCVCVRERERERRRIEGGIRAQEEIVVIRRGADFLRV